MISMSTEPLQHFAGKRLRVLLWEFVQNLPLVLGFLLGLKLWQQGRLWPAMASMVVGSVAGSFLISVTERHIVEGHREPLRVMLTNMAVIAGFMLIVTAYLAAPWSRWWLDLVLGVVAGTLLGMVQDVVTGSSIGWGHCAAMGLAFALALVALRWLASLPLVANVLIITAVLSVLIVLIDYVAFDARSSHEDTIS
jgi:hypothetical protein